MPSFCCLLSLRFVLISGILFSTVLAQEASTGAIRGTVADLGGGRVGGANVVLVNAATNFPYSTTTDVSGRFAFELLPPPETTSRARIRRECPRKPHRICM